MPIQINQKFPRCALCGKIIPLRAARVEFTSADGKPLGFCSSWCRDEFVRRAAAASGERPTSSNRISAGSRYRVGIDVGGTFTDLALVDESTGQLYTSKSPSTPGNPIDGVMR